MNFNYVLKKNSIYKILALSLISLFLILISILLGYPLELSNLIGWCTLAISLYLCYIYRYNTGLFLVMLFIAYSNYSIFVGVYLKPELRPSFMYTQLQGISSYGIGIICIFIFEVMTLVLSEKVVQNPFSISYKHEKFVDNFEYNSIVAYMGPFFYLAIFLLSFSMGADGERGTSSALNEYRTVIAIIGSYYSGRKRSCKYIWTIIIGLTSILIMLSGNRIDMFGSMICLISFWYPSLFTYKRILILLPIAVIFLAAVGYLRGNFTFSGQTFSLAIEKLTDKALAYDGAIWGYFPSLATIELSSKTTFWEKFSLFIDHIIYIFTFGPAKSINPDLSFYSRKFYIHYWGFISPIYFYFWFSFLGPIIFSLLVFVYNRLYQKMAAKKIKGFLEKLGYILSLYFICNVARWYAYGPMGLLRSMFVCTIAFSIVYAFVLFVERVRN